MLRKIKNLFLFLSLILLGIFSPLHFALAGWVGDLILFIPTRAALLIVRIAVEFAIFIVGLAGSLLNWVLSPSFTTLSYTNPAGNKVIEVGLDVTRGFVNMLLVIILVYIAIATILRLAGYETKKLLVTFIIVALLVNFSPVITGLIVDASNIIMNFFVQDLKADAFAKTMGAQVSMIMSGFSWMTASWEQASSIVMQLLIMNSFLLVLTLILLLFTVVFMLRHLVIWVLVILSPLAFVAYILPTTRKYFKQWWEQFLAWSFIGVTCGFFLYLGLLMVTLVPTKIPSPVTGEDPLFNSILPYFVSVVFLGIGLVFGLKTSAMGAQVTMKGFIRGEKAATKVAVKRGWEGIKKGGGVVKAETGRIKKTYETGRSLGLSRTKATGETARAYWQTRMRPAGQAIKKTVTTKTGAKAAAGAVIRTTWAAGKGVLSAVKDMAVAGTGAAFKMKKKGFKKCPSCDKQNVAKSAKTCPICGYDFE